MDFLFVSLFLASCDFVCAMGVKTSLTLGREEKSWGEGVSWAPTSSRENSSMCGEDLVVNCDIDTLLLYYGRHKEVWEEIDILCLERALIISLERA